MNMYDIFVVKTVSKHQSIHVMDTELGCIKNTVSEAELFNNR
jgi:hypothetical protein